MTGHVPPELRVAINRMGDTFSLLSWPEAYRAAAAMRPEICEEIERTKAPDDTESSEAKCLCILFMSFARAAQLKIERSEQLRHQTRQ